MIVKSPDKPQTLDCSSRNDSREETLLFRGEKQRQLLDGVLICSDKRQYHHTSCYGEQVETVETHHQSTTNIWNDE